MMGLICNTSLDLVHVNLLYSFEFCHKIGLDYVSCSPFRVPIARLAAAQAAIAEKAAK